MYSTVLRPWETGKYMLRLVRTITELTIIITKGLIASIIVSISIGNSIKTKIGFKKKQNFAKAWKKSMKKMERGIKNGFKRMDFWSPKIDQYEQKDHYN